MTAARSRRWRPPTWRGPDPLDRRAWAWLAGYYWRDRYRLALYVIVTGLQSLLFVPMLLLVRRAFDVAIPQGRLGLLVAIGFGLLLTRIANGLLVVVMRRLVVGVIKHAIQRLRADLITGLYGLSREFHVRSDPDRLHVQIVQETERADTLSNVLFSAVMPALVGGMVLICGLLWLDARLVALGVVLLPLIWLVNRAVGQSIRERVRDFRMAFEDFSRGVRFVLRHMELTRFKAAEQQEIAHQVQRLDVLRTTGERMAAAFAVHGQFQSNATALVGIAMLVAGGAAIASGTLTLGEFIAFYIAANLLNTQIDRVANAVPDLIAGTETLTTLRRILDAGPPVPYTGSEGFAWTGQISLRRVDFGYAGRRMLHDLNLEIDRQTNAAIIGPNGAGKTTILNLILGFIRPDAGAVLAAGLPYDRIDLASLRRRIGVVPQHPALFAGTVAENISYGLPARTRDDIIAAARRAQAEEFIGRLPDGFETQIGEGGLLLSGGEAQRVAIARALLGSPDLLILDEPTNHLDTDTIARLLGDLLDDQERPAILIISHDASVIRHARDVYRLDAGSLHLEVARPAATYSGR